MLACLSLNLWRLKFNNLLDISGNVRVMLSEIKIGKTLFPKVCFYLTDIRDVIDLTGIVTEGVIYK